MTDVADKIAAILADIPGFKAETIAKVRAEHPDMTEEQVESSWKLVADLYGLQDDPP